MKEKIYTAPQVLFATVIGGPVGGVYTLSKNIEAVDSTNQLLAVAVLGWFPTLLYILLFPYMPVALSLGLLPSAYCVATYIFAKRRNTHKQLVKMGKRYEYQKSANVAMVSVSSLAATLLTEFVWINVLLEPPII